MAKLNTGTRVYGSANVDGMLVVGQITPNNANVGLANTGSLQVWGGAYISGNTTIGGQSTTEQVYVQGNSNLLTYSQNLENAAWVKTTSLVLFGPSANTYAPDGTNTVSQLINNTGGSDTGYINQTIGTLNRNTPYTFSVYMKQGTSPHGQINMYAAGGGLNDASANVNFSTGTVALNGANIINSTFTPAGGGWYRVSITLNSLNQQQFINRLYLRSSGAAGEFGYFWGAQLEPGITPSAYANTSSGNIVKANNNLFVMGNTFIYGGNTSISNTTGSLVVSGGLGVSGNVNVSNTFSIVTESGGNRPFIMQPGVSGSLGARFGVVGESIDFYTAGGYPIWFASNGPRNAIQLAIATTSTPVNYLQVTGNTTGNGPVLSGQGSDTNVGINITPKGAGSANITSTANSTSNTSGALVVTGGMGITGNLFMSAANNWSTTTNEGAYRLGWTDNYFYRSPIYGGVYYNGGFLSIASGTFTIESGSSLLMRSTIKNDQGNNAVLFAGSSPVRLQNTAAAVSTTTGSLIVDGGAGVSGNLYVGNNLVVTGNLTITGNVSSQNVQQLAVADPLILLGIGNYTSDTKDIGFAAHYNDGTNAHAGIIRDSGTKEFYVFKGYTPEVDATNNVDITDASFQLANVNALYVKGNVITSNIRANGNVIIGNTTTTNTATMLYNPTVNSIDIYFS